MPGVLSEALANVDEVIASLTVLFPGFLTYFVYVGCRAAEYDELKRGHIVLVLFFTLFFHIFSGLSGGLMNSPVYQAVFYLVLPVVFGALADIGHRLFETVFLDWYQTNIIDHTGRLELIDVGNVSRWQKTIQEYVIDGLHDITKEYYVEVEISSPEETITKRGFLNGYSEDDIELLRYDDLAEKDFPGIGDIDVDEDQLTLNVELIPREKISAVRIYRVKMEDFELK